MKIAICDYPEPLNRDLDIERGIFRKGLGDDVEIDVYEHHGDVDALKAAISDADGVLTSYLEFPADVIESAPKLKGISIEATGYNFVDAVAAERQGTAVAVIGEYCTQEVADHTMALALGISKSLKHYDREIEVKHRYDWNSTSGMKRLEESTIGIMGLGKIGKAVARRAQGFGLTVVAYDPYCPPEAAAAVDVRLVDKEELFRIADIITLNMLLTPETEHILNREAFAMMERKPVIVNVSRGGLIDETALVEALDSGRVFGAGLDVLVDETNEGTLANPLVGRENVILTPHSAFYSDKALYECQRIASENLVHILRGEQADVFRMVNKVKVAGGGA
ncbi:4-phosphoerythronate dehydrogenase [Bifidobacterium lemurum]|uniref:4-phosphoerythronate dehydrogenase n=1 Tax=Bifidobacterium lemurum TaxID=1603886 RepID=A0A261FUR1_9BIFI|nr:NAD(P)-dependent oxidoreductase [Bifidobacterium lemurum]OZG62663.1 4-phosphoerythronate dehydrogenase [Bifidobacterium lemurum]QOL34615.1 C-terminal binding protein [Bifidobacterium lemurum]